MTSDTSAADLANTGQGLHWKDRWLRRLSLNRLLQTGLFSIGIALVIAGLSESWFDIPVSKDGATQSYIGIQKLQPACQAHFKALIASLLFGFLILRWIEKTYSMRSALLACVMVLIVFSFPYFVMLRDPLIAAEATWLQMQHDSLTWLGGDINTAAESGGLAWKSKVYLVDPTRHISVAPLPAWSAWQVGLDKIDDVLEWLGYSNVFCQFARSGWSCSMIGSALLLVMTWLGASGLDLKRVGYSILLLFVVVVVGAVLALQGPFGAKPILEEAKIALSSGDYENARRQMVRCGEQFPVITQDTYYVRQLGLIDFRLQIDSDYARLYVATDSESQGQYDQAVYIWRSLCESTNRAIQREALRALQRFATQDYNSGRWLLARERMEFVLAHQPANVKAIYFLQILSIREQKTSEVFELCDWMYAVSEYLNFGSTKVLKASSQQHAMLAAAQAGDAEEVWFRMRKGKKP